MSIRLLSHSEVSTALTCEARHSFQYTGRLTGGDALKAKTSHPLLRDGKAWGAGVAAYHEAAGEPNLLVDPLTAAGAAIVTSLAEDYEEQKEAGLADAEGLATAEGFLLELLDHFVTLAEPLPLERLEQELLVPIPSRRGRRRSNRYRLQAFLDGVHVDDDGREWVVEEKLRTKLTPFKLIAVDRQPRWYAWAAREALGINPVGVIVEERLKEIPKPARIVNAKRKGEGIDGKVPSHTADQMTTPELYLEACAHYGVEPVAETVEQLGARRWQQRQPIIFRPGELDEVGNQLVSAAKLIQQLDSGERFPVRNPSQPHCNGCRFLDICPNPEDRDLVDLLFERVPAKRDRTPEEVAA